MTHNDEYDPDAIFREFDDEIFENESKDEDDFNDGSIDLLYSLEDDDGE